MPRFIAKARVIEAWEYTGSTLLWPESFRLAVRRHLGDGTVEVVCGDGARVCRSGDWMMRGADGLFSVVHAAAFEAAFEELTFNGGLERVDAGQSGDADPGASGQRSVTGRRR